VKLIKFIVPRERGTNILSHTPSLLGSSKTLGENDSCGKEAQTKKLKAKMKLRGNS
jgi:hypothetical protein